MPLVDGAAAAVLSPDEQLYSELSDGVTAVCCLDSDSADRQGLGAGFLVCRETSASPLLISLKQTLEAVSISQPATHTVDSPHIGKHYSPRRQNLINTILVLTSVTCLHVTVFQAHNNTTQ